jgi:hypothetical protein
VFTKPVGRPGTPLNPEREQLRRDKIRKNHRTNVKTINAVDNSSDKEKL